MLLWYLQSSFQLAQLCVDEGVSKFVFASSCETFGQILLEGMASGVPIVCSDRGPMPDLLGDAGVYFDPYSVESISKAIKSILQDDSLTKVLIKKGEMRIKNFSWEKCSLETYNLYKKLISWEH